MTTFLLLALALVTASAIAALVHAMHGAVDGYEDELQFHHGVPSRPAAVGLASAALAMEQARGEGARFKRRPQLVPTEVAASEMAGISRRHSRR